MVIGLVKEFKMNEYRVSLTPDAVYTLVSTNNKILVEKSVGLGAGFSDEEYALAGATLLDSTEEVYKNSDMIVHVRRPHVDEYSLIKAGQIIFAPFHFLLHERQTRALLKLRAICISYESLRLDDGTYPVRDPISELSGKVAVLESVKYLNSSNSGSGVFVGGGTGVRPANVIVIGSGVIGANAARMAAKLGANVFLFGFSTSQLQHLEETLPDNVTTLMATPWNIRKFLPMADIVIGAVIIDEDRTNQAILTRQDLKSMKQGAVLVDTAVNYGGCFETSTSTTLQNPVYMLDGIVHYCVPNIVGMYAHTASALLSATCLPYIMDIATKGWKKSSQESSSVARALHLAEGSVVYKQLADAFQLPYAHLEEIL